MTRSCFSRRVAALSAVGLLGILLLAPFVVGQSGTVANALNPLGVQLQPPGSTGNTQQPWAQTGTGTTGAVTLTQPAVPGRTNYVTGIYISGSGATAASSTNMTLQSGGTTVAQFAVSVPVIGGAGYTYNYTFNPPLTGLGPGQTMVLAVPAQGAGASVSSATMTGYSQ